MRSLWTCAVSISKSAVLTRFPCCAKPLHLSLQEFVPGMNFRRSTVSKSQFQREPLRILQPHVVFLRECKKKERKGRKKSDRKMRYGRSPLSTKYLLCGTFTYHRYDSNAISPARRRCIQPLPCERRSPMLSRNGCPPRADSGT